MKNIASTTKISFLDTVTFFLQLASQKTQKFVNKHYKSALIFIGLLTALVVFQEASFAGTDGDDFADIYTKLEAWSKGTLGKVIALGMFLVGLATGVVQQSIIAVVIGISGALSLYYGPAIINSVVSALI
ncbi:MAG: pili assembly chaperone [Methylobacter sp.]|nr:MAG: pili assembly chaperone [Methylobacter sp.]